MEKNSTEIFGIALGLSEPWIVSSVTFEEVNKQRELHISLAFIKGSKFIGDDAKEYTAYDTVERTWQHLNFFQHRCFIHAKVPRIMQKDGRVITQAVPWARAGSGFTLLFEAFSMLLIEFEMPVSKVADLMGVYSQRIWTVFKYWVSKAHNADIVEDLTQLGFDETSTRKGHNYVTTAVDIKEKRVLFVTAGKGADCIAKTVTYLQEKKVEITEVKQVCIDMSPAFISGCTEHLPQAKITFDKFHIIKEVNKAMDELRKVERLGNDLLKGHKYTFLKNKLTPKIKTERNHLMEIYPKLGEGYKLTQMFKDFWELKDIEEAEGYLAYWCDIAIDTGIPSFRTVVNTVKAHWIGIINYIESKINNGILEGINSKIQLAKKRARGYANIDNFINMIYFICGKLKFDYPLQII